MLIYSPNHLFMFPGLVTFSIGFFLTVRFLFGSVVFAGREWDIHVMVFSGILSIVGWQILNLGYSAKVYVNVVGMENSPLISSTRKFFALEKVIIVLLILFASCYFGLIS